MQKKSLKPWKKLVLVLSCVICLASTMILPASAISEGTELPIPTNSVVLDFPILLSTTYGSYDPVRWVMDLPLVMSYQPTNLPTQPMPLYGSNDDLLGYILYCYSSNYFGTVVFNQVVEIGGMGEIILRCPMPIAKSSGSPSVFQLTSSEGSIRVDVSFNQLLYVNDSYIDSYSVTTEMQSIAMPSVTVAEDETFTFSTSQLSGDFLITDFTVKVTSLNDGDFPLQHLTVGSSSHSWGQSYFKIDSFLSAYDADVSLNPTIIESEFPTNWTDWLFIATGGILNAELFPGFTFGGLLAAIIGILLFMFFIHVFKG